MVAHCQASGGGTKETINQTDGNMGPTFFLCMYRHATSLWLRSSPHLLLVHVHATSLWLCSSPHLLLVHVPEDLNRCRTEEMIQPLSDPPACHLFRCARPLDLMATSWAPPSSCACTGMPHLFGRVGHPTFFLCMYREISGVFSPSATRCEILIIQISRRCYTHPQVNMLTKHV